MKQQSISMLAVLGIVLALTSAFIAPQHINLNSDEYMVYANPAQTVSPSALDLFGQGAAILYAYYDTELNEALVHGVSDLEVQETFCPTPLTPVCAAILKITRNGSGQIISVISVKVWRGTFTF